MDISDFEVDSDILRARTLPGVFYHDQRVFERQKQAVFAHSWQWIGVQNAVKDTGSAMPFVFLEGMLDEPLLLTREADGRIHCLSNVCTHRANILCHKPGATKLIRCRYHGRRFALDGSVVSAPGFEQHPLFPGPEDNLRAVQLAELGQFLFASLNPRVAFAQWSEPVSRYLGWIPLQQLRLDSTRSNEYIFDANWALYVDNYLEGLHIPHVHKALSSTIDFKSYETHLLENGVLQIATAKPDQPAFELPPSSPDQGKMVAAYYLWLFPNTMLNFYPWGLSVNIVRPLGTARTRVSFLTYVLNPGLLGNGVGADLHTVEKEDEEIVCDVHRGSRSTLYDRGLYAPEYEKGVHHFHRMLLANME